MHPIFHQKSTLKLKIEELFSIIEIVFTLHIPTYKKNESHYSK